MDSVEAVLEGFGAQRPDRKRIKPLPEPTPIPDAPVRRGMRPEGGSTTSPGIRQIETRRRYGAIVVVLLCVFVVCFVAWKMNGSGAPETVSTSTNATLPPPAPTPTPTETSTGIPVENLTPAPTETAVTTSQPTATAKPTTTAKATTTAPTVTAPTTAAPTTSGPDPKNDVKRTM